MPQRPLWRKQNQLVEAEQVTQHFCPEGVEVNRLGLTDKLVFTMLTSFGRVLIPPGTWIVYDDEGARPVQQAVFERLYKPLSVAGKAVATGERVLRKVFGG
jgi:hypothetical protein